ncbi:MAG: response regulator transcription factor [Deinococcales bacterium]
MPAQVRMLVGTPQLMVRQALTTVLAASPRLRVVGDVGSGKDALRWALEVRPDITLLDAALSPVDGVHAATAIHAEDPALRLVTLRDDDGDLGDVDDGGGVAAAQVSKRLGTSALIDVLLRVADGEEPGEVPERAPGAQVPAVTAAARGLKPAERALLELLVGGSDNRVLAERLGCSEKTIRNRLSDLYAKLHLHNRTQAALYAIRSGLVDPTAAGWG